MFDDPFESERVFRKMWDSIRIERESQYSLFTFGDSDLPYYLVVEPDEKRELVSVRKGSIHISRPMIIRPDFQRPEFENFFDDDVNPASEAISYFLSRTAAFSNLRFSNRAGEEKLVSDNVEESISRLRQQLDDQEEVQVGIITTRMPLIGFALFKYAIQKVVKSTPDNIQELRERGFLD